MKMVTVLEKHHPPIGTSHVMGLKLLSGQSAQNIPLTTQKQLVMKFYIVVRRNMAFVSES